ncbi:response regulator [Marinoscillum sp. 108]|uniref:response regulator n=1 Tax=Marinoscillum sp. 108 TaxID=2653151 RepID=UPI0012F0E7F7|nr:response regulator [Marinoscillum sp. 108]VXD13707.1 Two-component system response regulator [Marinoscillum sp. 108]
MDIRENQYDTVVLVEDNPDDAELTMRSLNSLQLGNQIIWLKDGAEAINYLFGQQPDQSRRVSNRPKLILLDLKLPKVNGIEVLKRIKSDDQMKTVPVVVMTSSNESVDLRTCYELGVNSFVTKPINYQEFIEATKNIGLYWLLVNQVPN